MKIGVLASVNAHINSFWLTLGDEIETLGHQVEFAASGPLDDKRYTAITGLTRRPSLRNIVAFRNLRHWAEDKKLDIVITNTATSSTLVRLAGLDVPVIYFAHGFHWDSETGLSYRIWSSIESALLSRTNGLLVLNQEDYRWAIRNNYRGPIEHLEFGVGLPLEAFPPSPIPKSKTAVWIGEFSPRKRPDLAIRATAQIVEAIPEFRLAMLGEGELRENSRRLAENLGLSHAISFPGHVDPSPYLTDATILLHSATWEGLPRVVLEAVAVGRPVVGPDVKGLRNLPGVVTSLSDSPAALATAAMSALDDPHQDPIDRRLLGVQHAAEQIAKFAGLVAGR